MRLLFAFALVGLMLTGCKNNPDRISISARGEIRDLVFFLHRLRTLDHLPELEASHTAMSSTWDTTGMNNDGWHYKNLKDSVYVLLDADGPGCIHRIFTGRSYLEIHETNFQMFVDGNTEPLIDLPVSDLFDPARSPLPYPLSSNKTYPGILFAIPYEKHIKVQLYSPVSENWGNYWQVVYTTYPDDIKVKSITYPFTDAENQEIQRVVNEWLHAERKPPEMPSPWPFEQKLFVRAGEKAEINLENSGIIKMFYVSAVRIQQKPGEIPAL